VIAVPSLLYIGSGISYPVSSNNLYYSYIYKLSGRISLFMSLTSNTIGSFPSIIGSNILIGERSNHK
jgi:hypothetical protein